MPQIPRGFFKQSSHNPNARAEKNYLVEEDLAHAPCTMSTLEVIPSFPSQWSALLSTIAAIDSSSSQVIMFETSNVKPQLPYHITFQIHVVYNTKTIFRMIMDEGASTCVMSLSCWWATGFPELALSPTLLTTFNGWCFRLDGIISSFLVQLGGKNVSIGVEVVDALLNYKLLLGHN